MNEFIRLIVTDMDGTLLDAHHQLPSNFEQIVQSLYQQNIRWAIASGRQLANLKARFDALAVPVDIIAENGAVAQCAGEASPFYCDLTSIEMFREILNVSITLPDTTPVLCGVDCAWVHDAHPEHLKEVSRYFCHTEAWHSLEEVARLQLCKVAIYHPNAATHLYPHLAPYATSDVRVILSGPNWVDVQRATIDKARALEALVKKYNLTLQNVMVFGDYYNDVGMLTSGAHAVAMGNALPEIQALTPHQTLPNTQNGVLHYLHACHLIDAI